MKYKLYLTTPDAEVIELEVESDSPLQDSAGLRNKNGSMIWARTANGNDIIINAQNLVSIEIEEVKS